MTDTILLVEDDEAIVEIVRVLLEGEGHRVDVAPNGRAALEVLSRADPLPSVILLDLMMPVMNGFEFRKAQLADPRIAAIPVVLMTADGHVAEKSAALGVSSGIGKPFEIDELLGAVARFAG